MAASEVDARLPHCLAIDIPFPTHRLAQAALRSLAVDQELSNLVTRDFRLLTSEEQSAAPASTEGAPADQPTLLRVDYRATTARMLRVAVNGFFESLNVVVQVMEELDADVLHEKGIEGLEGVQGVEQGLTGTAVGVGS